MIPENPFPHAQLARESVNYNLRCVGKLHGEGVAQGIFSARKHGRAWKGRDSSKKGRREVVVETDN